MTEDVLEGTVVRLLAPTVRVARGGSAALAEVLTTALTGPLISALSLAPTSAVLLVWVRVLMKA